MYAKKIFLYIIALNVLYLFGINYMASILEKQRADTPILTERQKAILKEEGLPEDYNKLEYRQQNYVDRCEILFKYLDYKYDEDFEYMSYLSGTPTNTERLYVYLSGRRDLVVRVEKTKKGFVDNYIEVSIREDFENYIKEFFTENYNIKNVKVYSGVTDTTITNLDEDLIFDNKVESSNDIYIDENAISKSEYENLVEEYHNWLIEHNLNGVNGIYFMKSGVIDDITRNNRNEYVFIKDYCVERFVINDYFND